MQHYRHQKNIIIKLSKQFKKVKDQESQIFLQLKREMTKIKIFFKDLLEYGTSAK
jgi:hypothetical protein